MKNNLEQLLRNNEEYGTGLRAIFENPVQGTTNEEIKSKLEKVEGKLDDLHRKLDLIFGDNVIINGNFYSTSKFKK